MSALDVQTVVTTQGSVPSALIDYARTKVEAALEHADRPVLSVRARLTVLPDPAVQRRAVAEAVVDLDGRTVRVQAVRSSLREAVDEVQDRLRDRVEGLRADWEARRGSSARSMRHSWRTGTEASGRMPSGPGRLVRRKSFSIGRATVEEAAFDMELLDHDFHLFVEDGTGQDSLLARAGDGYELWQLDPRPEDVTPGELPVQVSPRPAAELSVAEACERIVLSGESFLFFRDAGGGRGAVLYRRHDGDLGLITSD